MTTHRINVVVRRMFPSMTLVVMAICAASTIAARGAPVPSRTATAAIAEAVRTLTTEAKVSVDTGELGHRRADFRERFGQDLPAGMVLRKLARPVNRNAFFDSYVRWQLASFDPELDLDDREFQSMVERLPAMPVNVRADRQLINLLNTAVQNAPLSEGDRTKLNERISAMETTSDRAREFRRPSDGLRDWMGAKSSEHPERQLLVELERCDALIRGGWEIERTKAAIERLSERVGQGTVDQQTRTRLVKAMSGLSGRGSLLIRRVAIDKEAVNVDFDDASVHDFEVRRWVRLLDAGRRG